MALGLSGRGHRSPTSEEIIWEATEDQWCTTAAAVPDDRERHTPVIQIQLALLTCGIVLELVRQLFGIHLSEVSMGRLLKKLGLSRQKPLIYAYQQDSGKVRQYLETDYPKIQKRLNREGASIRSDYHSATT